MSEFENSGLGGNAEGNGRDEFVGASNDINNSETNSEGGKRSEEYHYGYAGEERFQENIYSDAHYVPEGENTVPPKYYTPPETKAKDAKPPHKGLKWTAIIAACLACAVLGSIGGAALIRREFSDRVSELETNLEELSRNRTVLTTPPPVSIPSSPVSAESGSGISAAQIYETACTQVVGISSNINVQSYFGTSTASVSGSGFILTVDGYVLTNYHVIEDAYSANSVINVVMHDGTSYPATVVGFEQDNDIAVLKIDAEGLSPAVIGDSDELRVGDVVYAVGNPLGELEFSMSTGHVSAKDRNIGDDYSADKIHMFQLDAAVNSGNSGGPVYNAQGQVVGIVTAKYAKSGVEGLGFAIPINDAASIASDIITKGYVTGKAYMSLSIRNDYTSMYAQYYGWPMGAMVGEVEEGGAAERAGIQAGDIITGLDGDSVESYNDLKAAVKQHSAGETVDVTLYRAGEELTLPITFDEATPDAQQQEPSNSQKQTQTFPQGGSIFEQFGFPGFSFGY